MPKVLVIGIGNILLGDDGIGVWLANELSGSNLPEDVDIIDAGTLGINLLPLIGDAEKLIIIDAIDAGLKAGEIVEIPIYRQTESHRHILMEEDLPKSPMLSLHETNIFDALKAAQLVGKLPKEVLLIGIQIASLKPSCGLSPELKGRMKKYVEAIRQICLREAKAVNESSQQTMEG